MKILVVDDHAVIRRGLRSLLEASLSPVTIYEGSNGEEAIERSTKEIIDLVILDLELPGRDGLDALRFIRHARPRLPVLILSVHDEEQMAIRALKAGASGYLNKEAAPEQLLQAVRAILQGTKYLTPRLAGRVASALSAPNEQQAYEALSDREFQVLRHLASGETVTEVAGGLSLSVKTVSTYRTRILEKLELHTNADLVTFALQSGLMRRGF